MRAQVIEDFGGPEVFRAADLPDPRVEPGHVLVRVEATSVNPVDTKIRAKPTPLAPDRPAVLGCDAAGVVLEAGAGVDGFIPGDRVYGCAGGVRGRGGAYAEILLADARLVAPAPPGLSSREAAALPLVTLTAWEGLFDRANLVPGETVLVHGGAGGVGHVAIQLAKAGGARVFATVSSAEKAAIARDLGADETIAYRDEAVEDYVGRLTGGRGFDLVFDATGGSDLATSLKGARVNGRVVTIVAQYTADLTPMHEKGLSLHVVFMLLPMLTGLGLERQGAILREAAGLVADGRLRPLIDGERFALDRVADAHRRLESGGAVGKVVVDVAADA